MKSLLIVVTWMFLGTVSVSLISYVPAALGIIDARRLGLLVASLILQAIVLFLLAGVLFVLKKRRAAYVLTGAVLAGFVLLITWGTMKAASRRGESVTGAQSGCRLAEAATAVI